MSSKPRTDRSFAIKMTANKINRLTKMTTKGISIYKRAELFLSQLTSAI